MRVIKLVAMLTLCCVCFSGCGMMTGEVENQAYVLVLGIDRLPDGGLGLTARVPRVGRKDAGDGAEGGSGSPYLTFSALGESWPVALDALDRVTPRAVNLSHIVMIVVSEALAGENAFPELLTRVAATPHLYATAQLVVCEGMAGDFVRVGETVIGTRMSSELDAMLNHYAAQGYVPRSTLADAYFATNAIYGDTTAIHAAVEPGAGEDTPSRQRYLGAALFQRGVYIRALSPRETQLLGVIRGEVSGFTFGEGADALELVPRGVPSVHIDTDGERPRVTLRAGFSTQDSATEEGLRRAQDALRDGIMSLVGTCRRLGSDPFGFAEIAASRFLTVGDWLQYDWRQRFRNAEIAVEVDIRCDGA